MVFVVAVDCSIVFVLLKVKKANDNPMSAVLKNLFPGIEYITKRKQYMLK